MLPSLNPSAAVCRSAEKSTQEARSSIFPRYEGSALVVRVSKSNHSGTSSRLETSNAFALGAKATANAAPETRCFSSSVSASQILTVLSLHPAAIILLSGENVKLPHSREYRLVLISRVVSSLRFHTFTDASRAPLARRRPSGENASDQTAPRCPRNSFGFRASVATSHNLIVSSELPLASVLASAENANVRTGRTCALKVLFSKVTAFQRKISPLPSPAARMSLTGEKCKMRIWRFTGRVARCFIVRTSQS